MAKPFKRLRESGGGAGLGAGLPTALGAGLVLGPIPAIALGVTQGILARRLRKSQLDERAAAVTAARDNDAGIAAALERAAPLALTDIDRAQLADISDKYQSAHAMTQDTSEAAQARGYAQMEELRGSVSSWLEDLESDAQTRATEHRQIIRTVADEERDRGLKFRDEMSAVQTNVNRVHSLLNDPKFDPNDPESRGILIDLLKGNARSMNTDVAGIEDAIAAAGGGVPLAGGLLAAIGGYMDAEDFDTNKDDWRRIAVGLQEWTNKRTQAEFQRMSTQANLLDAAATKTGAFPPGYSVKEYMLGIEDEFPNPIGAEGSYPEAPDKTDVVDEVADDPRAAAANVLNTVAGTDESQRRALETAPISIPGNLGRPQVLRDFFDRVDRLPTGTELRIDEDSGRAWATLPDGTVSEVQTSRGWLGLTQGMRGDLIELMRQQRARRAEQRGGQ